MFYPVGGCGCVDSLVRFCLHELSEKEDEVKSVDLISISSLQIKITVIMVVSH